MSLALRQLPGPVRLVLPPHSAEEAALVPGAEVFRARHLLDVVQQFLPPPGAADAAPPEPGEGWVRLLGQAPTSPAQPPDLSEVKGQSAAKRVLEIAAAGGHSVLMVGPPGSGKSMLAQRFAGLLPPMSLDEALEAAAMASLAGRFDIARWGQRPTAQPHHTASAVALVGGGSPPRPATSRWRTTGCCFWMNFRSSPAARSKPCASRWRQATSPSCGQRGGPSLRPAFS